VLLKHDDCGNFPALGKRAPNVYGVGSLLATFAVMGGAEFGICTAAATGDGKVTVLRSPTGAGANLAPVRAAAVRIQSRSLA
jgi:hypothetical protein